jgi:hypothetical protein
MSQFGGYTKAAVVGTTRHVDGGGTGGGAVPARRDLSLDVDSDGGVFVDVVDERILQHDRRIVDRG